MAENGLRRQPNSHLNPSGTMQLGELGETFPFEDAGKVGISRAPIERTFAYLQRAEQLRRLASFFRVDQELKIAVGNVDGARQLERKRVFWHSWLLGRMAQ